jgi:hypothetical protein
MGGVSAAGTGTAAMRTAAANEAVRRRRLRSDGRGTPFLLSECFCTDFGEIES